MKSDVTGSPSEGLGTRYTQEGMSAEHDLASDDEPETELEALHHLPPEERRKALRRLRNRESARRVRARRLAEMSQMETTVQGMQDENTSLKEHVTKLQGHIQQMTMKVYEVTAKYEAAVAENAQLRAELQRSRRGSVPESGFTATPSASLLAAQPPLLPSALLAAAASQGPNSAPHLCQPVPQHTQQNQQQERSSLQMGGDGAGTNNTAATAPGCLPSLALGSHAQLRNSNAMDLAQQRAALDEVVMLLHEHKHRRNQGPDRSACSEIGSSAVGNTAAGAVHLAVHANSFSTGVNNNNPSRSTGVHCLHIRTSSIMNDGSAAVGSGSGGLAAAAPPNATSPALDVSAAAGGGLMPAYGSGLTATTPSINNAGGPGPVPLSFLTASGSANSGGAGFGAAGAGAALAAAVGGHRASSPMDMITAASVAAASAGIVAAAAGDGSGGRPSRSDGVASMLQMTPQQVSQQHQLMAQMQQQQQQQQSQLQLQQQMAAAAAANNGSSGLSHLGVSYSMDAAFMTPQQQQQLRLQQQAQQQQQAQGPSSAFDLTTGLSQMQMHIQQHQQAQQAQQAQQQQQAMVGASHSQPLLKMQLAHHQQFSHTGQQQNMVLDGSGNQQHTAGQSQPLMQMFQHHSTASPDFAKMSAAFRSGDGGFGGGDGASAPLPTIPSSGTLTSNGQLSGLERGVLGGGSMYLGGTGGTGTGMAGAQQVTFHSASFALDRRTGAAGLPPPHPHPQQQQQPHSQFPALAGGLRGGAGGMNICFQQQQEQQAMMQQHGLGAEGWHLNAVAAGVAALKPEDISEDMMMTLDELSPFVPQDL
ncbi:hypothetical protein HXX76_003925 [Chlamydomonas incerta]|uniref:BZIP domain-containing protein n=1 Tax=Chlamydomonas incerta TaxID=51695 RepID=A0A835W597_CHLIN|nr:hypothetical protein HXX76_003925 [Chlamydomonas incerta]|eukprot:KAG2441072.1 hypothetical protein HXX76_003925 [Chlamydomonas incerta]